MMLALVSNHLLVFDFVGEVMCYISSSRMEFIPEEECELQAEHWEVLNRNSESGLSVSSLAYYIHSCQPPVLYKCGLLLNIAEAVIVYCVMRLVAPGGGAPVSVLITVVPCCEL